MNNLITINVITYNESVMIQFFIDHYRKMFPNCKIRVYDNYSTDNTVEIALSNNCEVIPYDSGNEIRDDIYIDIKNNCHKYCDTPFIFVGDCDEIVFITQEQLLKEQKKGVTVISFEGWNMITMSDDPDIIDLDLHWASRASQYDKIYIYNREEIPHVNYSAGAHFCTLTGNVKYSNTKYLMCHFKALGLNYMINRHTEFGKRLSRQNLEKGWGFHYKDSEQQIRDNWKFYQEHPDNKKIL